MIEFDQETDQKRIPTLFDQLINFHFCKNRPGKQREQNGSKKSHARVVFLKQPACCLMTPEQPQTLSQHHPASGWFISSQVHKFTILNIVEKINGQESTNKK